MFMFIYSPREGTPAAELDDPFTREEKVKRFDRLTALQNEISLRKHEEYIGTVQRVLIDGTAQRGEYNLTSRTNGGRLVHLRGPESLIGEFAFAKVTQAASWALFGELE